jgi:hypothetical protein
LIEESVIFTRTRATDAGPVLAAEASGGEVAGDLWPIGIVIKGIILATYVASRWHPAGFL